MKGSILVLLGQVRILAGSLSNKDLHHGKYSENTKNVHPDRREKGEPLRWHQTYDLTWMIVSVTADGKARMKRRIDRTHIRIGPTVKMEFDSKDGTNRNMGQFALPYQNLAGAEVTVVMDTHGRLSDLAVPKNFTDAFASM